MNGLIRKPVELPGVGLAQLALHWRQLWVAERIASMREAGVTHLQVTPVLTGGQSEASLIREIKELAA